MSCRPNWIRPLRRSNQPNLDLNSRRRTLNVILSTPELPAGTGISPLMSRLAKLRALDKYWQGRAIIKRLVTQSPDNGQLSKDLAAFDDSIAKLEQASVPEIGS